MINSAILLLGLAHKRGINVNNVRTATIIVEEDSHLGSLEKKYFEVFLKDANEKKRRQNVNFLISTNVFYGYDRLIFQKKYFNLFVEEKAQRRAKLFKEGDNLNYIYFVKTGEIELHIKTSLTKLKKLICVMGGKPNNPIIIIENPPFNRFLKETILIKVKILKN